MGTKLFNTIKYDKNLNARFCDLKICQKTNISSNILGHTSCCSWNMYDSRHSEITL